MPKPLAFHSIDRLSRPLCEINFHRPSLCFSCVAKDCYLWRSSSSKDHSRGYRDSSIQEVAVWICIVSPCICVCSWSFADGKWDSAGCWVRPLTHYSKLSALIESLLLLIWLQWFIHESSCYLPQRTVRWKPSQIPPGTALSLSIVWTWLFFVTQCCCFLHLELALMYSTRKFFWNSGLSQCPCISC